MNQHLGYSCLNIILYIDFKKWVWAIQPGGKEVTHLSLKDVHN